MPEQLATGRARLEQLGPRRSRLLLAAGLIACSLSVAAYLLIKYLVRQPSPAMDFDVFRQAGMVVRHVAPWYDPGLSSPLYYWPQSQWPFTYPPFAALVFTVLTVLPAAAMVKLWVIVSLVAMLVALWITFGGLGYRAGARLGATLLIGAVTLWTEPVLQTLAMGQVELVLMALLMWDLCQSDQHRWKGIGVGIAAGLKLVPLIFIPYFLLTRKFRQSAVASATFAGTVLLGYIVQPADSRKFWLTGLFFQGKRAGFPGAVQNQALDGVLTRFAGSMDAGHSLWLPVAILIGLAGLIVAAQLHRAGHEVVGVLTCALAGLLVSPISWDDHWTWIAPALGVLAVYAWRARGRLRWTYAGVATAILVLFAAWPHTVQRLVALALWGKAPPSAGIYFGAIYAVPSQDSDLAAYARLGDQRWYPEYHWHGLQVVFGKLYVLVGVVLLGLLAAAAVTSARSARHEATRQVSSTVSRRSDRYAM